MSAYKYQKTQKISLQKELNDEWLAAIAEAKKNPEPLNIQIMNAAAAATAEDFSGVTPSGYSVTNDNKKAIVVPAGRAEEWAAAWKHLKIISVQTDIPMGELLLHLLRKISNPSK